MLKNLYRHLLRPGTAGGDADAGLAEVRGLMQAGSDAAARLPLARYLERYPHDPEALHLMGLLELRGGAFATALEWLARAVRYDPDNPVHRANLGLALWRLGDLAQARAEIEAALVDASLATMPGLAGASLNLANIMIAQGQPSAARARLTQTLSHGDAIPAADRGQLWVALAGLAPHLPEVDALECLDRAREADPALGITDLLRYMPLAQQCDWRRPIDGIIAFCERHADDPGFEEGPALAPAVADCLPLTRAARLGVARRYACMIAARAAAVNSRPPAVARKGGGKVRIGYLSADFHNHPTMQLLRGVLAAHDRSRFELHAYSIGPDDGSGVRQEVESRFDCFNDIAAESPRESAARIAADGIDILVDLKGYTGGARPEIVALRPAPVQVSYLGYPGTMAADFVDYLIADPVLVPQGDDKWYSEKVVRLPYSYQPNDDAQAVADESFDREAAGLPADAFVFCSFNSTYKIEPGIFSVWMEVLKAVPGSVMWIHADLASARANLRREAQARGVDPARLVFAATLPKARHLARIRMADLFLDTHFVNAHTTASDALWAGVPLLTCPGESFASRVAASLALAAGLGDLVCNSLAAYRALAVELGNDPARMRTIRERLAAARRTCPLFDTASYTRQLESAYAVMHAIACAGDPPAAFCVPRPRRPRVVATSC